MTFEETAAALLAAEQARKDAARKAREMAKRKAEQRAKRAALPPSMTETQRKDAAYRQAFRNWASADVETFDRTFRAALPVYRAPESAIHPVKR